LVFADHDNRKGKRMTQKGGAMERRGQNPLWGNCDMRKKGGTRENINALRAKLKRRYGGLRMTGWERGGASPRARVDEGTPRESLRCERKRSNANVDPHVTSGQKGSLHE